MGDLVLDINGIERLKNIIVLVIDNFRDELIDYAYKKYYFLENDNKRFEYEIKKETELDIFLKEYEELS